MVGQNFEKLSYILKKLEQIDPVLLDQLNYYYTKEVPIDDDDDYDSDGCDDPTPGDSQVEPKNFNIVN